MRNRVVMMATVNNLGRNDLVTPSQVAFYEARARAGVAAIVTEGLSVHPTSIPNPTVPLAYQKDVQAGLAVLTQAVHAHGALIFGQLWHVGRNALWNVADVPWSPSPERDPFSGTTPHELTLDEIRELIDAFVLTAAGLQRAGFDGVEVHGAHGYLITQFLSPWSNKRTDSYGGDTEKRTRFVIELLRGIRAACGPRFVVGLKLSIDEFVPGGITLEESARIIDRIRTSARPDYFGVSQANFATLERHVPDMRFPASPFVNLARGIRDVAHDIPIIFMGRIRSPLEAEAILESGDADLIGMSRPLLADAELVAKAERGEADRIRPCVYCNVCWEAIHSQRAIVCVHAPETGRESELRELRAVSRPSARQIRVIGAGPSGLATAVVAARRGHTVDVYEADDAPGGQLRLAAFVPGREEFARIQEHLLAEASRAGVKIHTREAVDADAVETWIDRGNTVVLATGSEPTGGSLETGLGSLTLESALPVEDWTGKQVVVVDEIDDEPTYALAETIAARGARVHLLTRRPQVGRRVAAVSMMGAFRRLDVAGVQIVPLHIPVRHEADRLIIRHVFSGNERQIAPVDTLIWCGPYRARDDLARELRARGRAVRSVGDCYAPRGAMLAILDGHLVGREL